MKKESFWNMLEQTEPDIIIASETWLHQGILEREVLPENYRFVARRDRLKSAHRGVAVIAKSGLEGVEVGTPSDTEFVAESFTCKYLKKPLIVGSLYRPPGNNQKYAEDLCRTISSLSALYRDSTIWIGGDANLPDIEWDTTSIKGNRYTIPINNTIINTMFDAGCEQVVNFATRAVNTLDLFFTNRPSLVNKCLPLPGLSDHDIVLVDTNITPARQNLLKDLFIYGRK
jgi:exonuclease III